MIRSSLLAAIAVGALLPSLAAAQTMPAMSGHDHSNMHSSAKPEPASPAPARTAEDHSTMGHGAMDHGAMDQSNMNHGAMSHDMMAPDGYVTGSGTSRLPGNEGMHGLHFNAGDWALMAHGFAWGAYTDQGGPRGDSSGFVTSMAMLTATRPLGDGARLSLRSMLSLEPLLGRRGYPNLFATGETADGITPLIDRQHPHDLFMELAARIDVDAGPGSVFLYAAPVGEPAIGPSAFMMRASARYQSLSPITHHWFDSTHISYGVVTAGYAAPRFQIEASAFRGREPDQFRWDFEAPRLDSWSVRASWSPSPAWAMQVSHGFLKSPEQLEADLNERRTTASLHYGRGGLAATLAFSAKNKGPGRTLTAWLAEANWDISRHHSIFGRLENVANDELFPDHSHPLHDQRFRVTKAEGGYAYRLQLTDVVNLALGGSVAGYAYPAALVDDYGNAPISYTLFAKLSLGQ